MAWLLTTAGLQKSLTEEMIGAIIGNRGQKEKEATEDEMIGEHQ